MQQPITELIGAVAAGDEEANEELWEMVYDQLWAMAHARLGFDDLARTLETTELLAEAYLYLFSRTPVRFSNRRHFFVAAAKAMRRILVEHARPGTGMLRQGMGSDDPCELLAIDEALNRLEQVSPRQAQVVLLRYFAGLTIDETVERLCISPQMIDSDWRYARSWLHRELSKSDTNECDGGLGTEASRWKTMPALFTKVLRESPERCRDIIDEACPHDADLRSVIESLLAHDRQVPEDFLRLPEPAGGVYRCECGSEAAPLIGKRIGHYHVRSIIATGGMGTVYLAEQDYPRRKVALKIMTRSCWSRSAQRRFKFETEILGRLHHPNIAQVYESGVHQLETGTTVPFSVLEYISGAKPITTYCVENGLDHCTRLKLFSVVCDAVHYGHQKGIIHRDLKPGNILVDEQGHVKIIDFGVASSTDSEIAATTVEMDIGQIIGTLQYMSPEQCEADPRNVDIRTDVYSLGVVLFQLLTEHLPYDVSGCSIQEACRMICEKHRRRPSFFRRNMPRKLEVIVLKALEKDRELRYQSVGQLGRDIERWLENMGSIN